MSSPHARPYACGCWAAVSLVQATSTRRHAPDQYMCDLLKVADARLAEKDGLIRELNDEKKTVDARISSLQAQIQRRDEEIDRIGKQLEVLYSEFMVAISTCTGG